MSIGTLFANDKHACIRNSSPLLLTGSSTSSSSDMNKFDGDRSGVRGSNNSSGDWFPDSSPAGCYGENLELPLCH